MCHVRPSDKDLEKFNIMELNYIVSKPLLLAGQ